MLLQRLATAWFLVAPIAGFITAAPGQDPGPAPAVRFVSFNIRYSNHRDGASIWPMRRHVIAGLLRLHRADVFGVQEAMAVQVRDLRHLLPGYESFGAGRDGRAGGERCQVFYKAELFDVVREKTFWLSSTPDRPSRSFGNRLRRICTWGELRDKRTGETFFVFNTHFDHRSENSRRESAKLMLAKVAEIAGAAPAIVMGDLNCDENSGPYKILTSGQHSIGGKGDTARRLRDTAKVARLPNFGFAGTWTGFGANAAMATAGRIDYVFTKNDVRVEQHAVLPHNWAGKVASDHRPVLAEVRLHVPHVQLNVQMNEGWRFRTDPKKEGRKLGWHRFGHDDSTWKTLWAGEPWELQGVEYDGVAFYRKAVTVPLAWQRGDHDLHLLTRGIGNAYTVWINEERVAKIGHSRSDFLWTSTWIQLPRSALRYGKENLVVFEVRNYRGFGGLTGYPIMLTVEPQPTSHASLQFRHTRLLPLTKWGVVKEKRRTLEYPFRVPKLRTGVGWLRISIGHGFDDSGDGGLHYRLVDPAGEVVARGVSKERGRVLVQQRVPENTLWKLVLEDLDTALTGPEPGNRGTVEVMLRHARPARPAMQRTPPRPRGVPPGSKYFAGSWYWFSDDVMPYAKAKELAKEKKGKLLIVSSITENDWVMEQIHGMTFLGVERKKGNRWEIQGDAPRQFFYWDPGEPNNSRRERFVVIGFNPNGRWHDVLDHESHYVCIEFGREPR